MVVLDNVVDKRSNHGSLKHYRSRRYHFHSNEWKPYQYDERLMQSCMCVPSLGLAKWILFFVNLGLDNATPILVFQRQTNTRLSFHPDTHSKTYKHQLLYEAVNELCVCLYSNPRKLRILQSVETTQTFVSDQGIPTILGSVLCLPNSVLCQSHGRRLVL